ncbi:MAG TPA: alpha/beta fold hydrolase [Longimicrobium sp.]|jgi:pimeloyl-ACP methyl ester carboxylesterase
MMKKPVGGRDSDVTTIRPLLRRLAVGACVALGVTGATAGYVASDLTGEPAGPDDRRELVVLVHGMGRSRASMWLLGRSLEAEGYRVLNWGYSSYSDPVPALGARLARDVSGELGRAPKVHFVGHSLGNVIVRWALAHEPPARAGRVVMLAPPNQGAAAADRYARYAAWLMPPIEELRTAPGSTVRTLPAPRGVDVGVIAGAHDGKVSVDETHLAGERDHVVVPAAHSFIMNRRDVRDLTLRFLRTGRFGAGG